VLGRAAAEQQCDAQSFGHVVVSRIGPLAGDFAESGGIGQPASTGGSAPGKGREAKRGGATPSAVWPGIALGVIDRGPAANGVDRSTSCDTPRLKLPAIGIITYVKRV
jgi:hypothetical protein